ncbi:hypothetical protein GOP47_0012814 [Adiantum capillus-veneris]|uniref:CCHC-type domain-containing protein n=1 Tax=Adiantum capillus-veneris TaxID=13818 RepID=A0A9D4USS5_ADICA|nr:hypothetical protein GOP47_0012814 [Adiantum capillus-veneris]
MEGKKACESLGDRAQFALVANVEKNLHEVGNSARQYRILPSSDMVFEILTSTKTCVVDAYCNTYSGVISPIVDASEDASDQLKPPATRRPPGRPKKLRIRTKDRFKEKRIFTCSRCGGLGHNEHSCKAPIAD